MILSENMRAILGEYIYIYIYIFREPLRATSLDLEFRVLGFQVVCTWFGFRV